MIVRKLQSEFIGLRMASGFAMAACVAFLQHDALGRSVPETLLLDGVAAQVNESFITIGEVMEGVREIEPRLAGATAGPAGDSRLREIYRQVRSDLVDRELILQAYREGDGKIPAWVIDQRIAEIVVERFEGDRALLRAALAEQGMEMAEWRKQLEAQMILSAMRHAHAEQPAVVSPEMIRAYYEQHSDRFSETAATRIQLIVLRPESDTAAARTAMQDRGAEALMELKSGAPFEAVARRYSVGRNAEAGGDWGWLDPETDLRVELAQAAAGLEPGEHSGLITTPEEAYVLRVLDRRPARTRSLEEVSEDIHLTLRQARAEALYQAWIDRLRASAIIVKYELP